jgi:hypothetical protein
MGAGASKPPTFYHDYGAEGWVFIMGNRAMIDFNDGFYPDICRFGNIFRCKRFEYDLEQFTNYPPPNTVTPSRSAAGVIYTTNQDLLNKYIEELDFGFNRDPPAQNGCGFMAPTITQYPRSGKVSQGSDNNISFGGSGYTYTMDFGPYVDINNPNKTSLKGITISPAYGGNTAYLMWARSRDPDEFILKDSSGKNIQFEIRKIDSDVRGWPAWYLWVEEPLKPGTFFQFSYYQWMTTVLGANDDYIKLRMVERRLGQTEGGVRYAPVTDAFGSTWTLNHP